MGGRPSKAPKSACEGTRRVAPKRGRRRGGAPRPRGRAMQATMRARGLARAGSHERQTPQDGSIMPQRNMWRNHADQSVIGSSTKSVIGSSTKAVASGNAEAALQKAHDISRLPGSDWYVLHFWICILSQIQS